MKVWQDHFEMIFPSHNKGGKTKKPGQMLRRKVCLTKTAVVKQSQRAPEFCLAPELGPEDVENPTLLLPGIWKEGMSS